MGLLYESLAALDGILGSICRRLSDCMGKRSPSVWESRLYAAIQTSDAQRMRKPQVQDSLGCRITGRQH